MEYRLADRPTSSVREQFNLKGKNVLISGGAGFLGWYFVEAIAEMGGYPILLDVEEEGLISRKKKLLEKGISCET